MASEPITAQAAQAIADEATDPAFAFTERTVTIRFARGTTIQVTADLPSEIVRLRYTLTKEKP